MNAPVTPLTLVVRHDRNSEEDKEEEEKREDEGEEEETSGFHNAD